MTKTFPTSKKQQNKQQTGSDDVGKAGGRESSAASAGLHQSPLGLRCGHITTSPHKYKTVKAQQWTHSWCNTQKWKQSLISLCFEHTSTQDNSENTVDKTHTKAKKPSISLEAFILIWIEPLQAQLVKLFPEKYTKNYCFHQQNKHWVVILVSCLVALCKAENLCHSSSSGFNKCSQALKQRDVLVKVSSKVVSVKKLLSLLQQPKLWNA